MRKYILREDRNLLVAGIFISQSGSWFYLMAMQWLLVEPVYVTASAALSAMVTITLGSLTAHMLSDTEAKRDAKIGNILLGVLSLLIGALVFLQLTSPWILIGLNIVGALISLFKTPAEDALFALVGQKSKFLRDLCKKLATRYVARALVGFFIAVMTATVGIHGLFFFDGFSFFFIAWANSKVTLPKKALAESQEGEEEERPSLREYVRDKRPFLVLLLLQAFQNGVGFMIFPLLPALTKDVETYGYMMMFAGSGSILSAILTYRWLNRSPGKAMTAYVISGIGGTLPLAVVFLLQVENWTIIAIAYNLANVIGTVCLILTEFRCQRGGNKTLNYRLLLIFYSGISQLIRLALAATIVPLVGVRMTIGWGAAISSVVSALIIWIWRKELSREMALPDES